MSGPWPLRLAWLLGVAALLTAGLWSAWVWLLPPLFTLLAFAVEMLAVAAQHRDDPAPRPTASQLARAACREALLSTRVFGWRQVWHSRAWSDRLEGSQMQGRTGVLLLHGYRCNRGFWWPEWPAWLDARGLPHVALELGPTDVDIDRHSPQVEAAVARLVDATGHMPLLVAHSMGGLVVRAWWRWREARRAAGVDLPDWPMPRVLTLGTPHRGTWLTRLSPHLFSTSERQMAPDNPWLQALAASESPRWRARFICVHSHCDNVVFPPARAVLEGAMDVHHWPGLAHLELSRDARVWKLVEDLLARGG